MTRMPDYSGSYHNKKGEGKGGLETQMEMQNAECDLD